MSIIAHHSLFSCLPTDISCVIYSFFCDDIKSLTILTKINKKISREVIKYFYKYNKTPTAKFDKYKICTNDIQDMYDFICACFIANRIIFDEEKENLNCNNFADFISDIYIKSN